MPEFIPGRELSGQFYAQAVRPILDREFPGVPHSAALIGPGSDALGYDTPRSTDHDWGPRILLLLQDDDASRYATHISTALANQLPLEFLGFSTHFVREGDSRVARPIGAGPVNHKVKVGSLGDFLHSTLGLDPSSDLSPVDWLVTPEQGLLEITAGPVFHDGLGQLTPLRAKLAYYPRDVWLYRLASQWRRLAQLEAFVGRTAEVGDELGSRLIAASLVRDLIRISFLQERTYAPYPKWFGIAFARLAGAADQLSDSTDLLTNPVYFRGLAPVYGTVGS